MLLCTSTEIYKNTTKLFLYELFFTIAQLLNTVKPVYIDVQGT